jgi:hypothetical protein
MSGYIGNIPTPQATQTRNVYTAAAGQTTFGTSGYTPGFVDVFLNGIHLVNGSDYTASNGTEVVLTTGAAAGDNVEVVAYTTFSLSDNTFPSGLTVDNANATVLTVDRATSDGTIVDLQKDGSSVGNIGAATASGVTSVYTGNDDTALWFRNGIDAVTPFSISGNTTRDAAIDFGQAGGRFKDLYLSGGVYLGGTGSANYLDDYEEGTWTPTITASSSNPSITYAVQSGQYTKIGQMVNLHFYIRCTAFSGGSGDFRISGIPFSATSTSGFRAGNVSPYYRYITNNGASIVIYIYETASFLSLTKYSDADQWDTSVNVGEVTSGNILIGGGISYITNA